MGQHLWHVTKSAAVIAAAAAAGLAYFPYSFAVFDATVLLMLLYHHTLHFEKRENNIKNAIGLIAVFVEAAIFSISFSFIASVAVNAIPSLGEWAARMSSEAMPIECVRTLGADKCSEYLVFVTPMFFLPFIYISLFHKRYIIAFHSMMSACKYPTGATLFYCCAITAILTYASWGSYCDNIVHVSTKSLHPIVDPIYSFVRQSKFFSGVSAAYWSVGALFFPMIHASMILCIVSSCHKRGA